jgi:type I protein arginine methyltransferase
MYSLRDYGRMIRGTRPGAYARALAEVIRPGDRVLDLGAGAGFCTLLALRAGASEVIAIDTNPMVNLIPEVLRENGIRSGVRVIQGDSRELSLDSPVDVVVADLRGVLPLYGTNYSVVRDAKSRLLKPGGHCIPLRDRVYCAPVEAEGLYAASMEPFGLVSPEGFATESLRVRCLQAFHHDGAVPFTDAHMLADEALWGEFTYGESDVARASGSMTFTAHRDSTCHGLAMWFEGQLTEGIAISSSPRAYANGGKQVTLTGSDVYGRAFLPFVQPLGVLADESLSASVFAQQSKDDYLWAWTLRGTEASSVRENSSFPTVLNRS